MRTIATMTAACALAGMAGSALAQAPAAPPAPVFFGAKLAVADFDRSVGYYTTFFPIRKDQVYNDHEVGLAFTDGGAARIVLWLNTCGKPTPTPAERKAAAEKAASPVQKELQLCASKFQKGGGWVVVRVPDLKKTSAALTAAGYPAPLRPDARLFITKDPDGNIVEAIQQ